MSNRASRIKARLETLRTREHLTQVRLANAERGLHHVANQPNPTTTDVHRAEVDEARAVLAAIHEEQQRLIAAADTHTTNLPDMAMIMVEAPNGYRIIEHRDPDGTATDTTCWYDLNASDDEAPMTFAAASGDVHTDTDGVDRYHPYPFYRLYTQDEVDDLLDHHGVNI